MNILHVRSVPDDLYARLQKLAQSKNRSLSAQVIIMLNQAIEDEERRKKQAKTLNSIRRRRFTPPKNAPTSLELLKEDRSR
jgi:plasmid stability protein